MRPENACELGWPDRRWEQVPAGGCSRSFGLLLTPRIERVIHRGLEFDLPMIVRSVQDPEATCDGREPRPLWGSVHVLRNIRRMDDLGEPNQGWIAGQVEVFDQRLE